MTAQKGPIFLGVYCRPNHPIGYGYVPVEEVNRGHYSGTAHGYITIIVVAPDKATLDACSQRLNAWDKPKFDPWKRGDDWYAGPYELVWSGRLKAEPDTTRRQGGDWDFPLGEAMSYGDNRACAYLTAEQVLA